jgi:FkbM family methyltransferase
MPFSQNEEDRYITAACPGPSGRFLDIGAWSAIAFSNTRALFEQGWGGVMIEPSPLPYAKIVAEYAGVPDRIAVVNAAVGIVGGTAEFWITEDALSTSQQAVWLKWRKAVKYEPLKATVPMITIEELYAQYGDFDFVNIDTEGTSVDLCLRLMLLGHRPKCICVEHDDRIIELLGAANVAGYACTYASGENLVLVRQ